MTTYNMMPYQKLIAFQVAKELLALVREARIADGKLRDQALRAARSVCLNIAEASGRSTPADQKRVFAIARGELSEVAGALEIAAMTGDCAGAAWSNGQQLALRAHALLTALIRK